MFDEKPRIVRRTQDNNGYFTLYWSKLTQADKYTVVTGVPSVSGLYEMYYADEKNMLNLLTCSSGWYGGLRSQIREALEADFQKDEALKAILTTKKLYMRYTCSDVLADMQDVLWFLHTYYFKDTVHVSHSQRYKRIFLSEHAPDKIHWV